MTFDLKAEVLFMKDSARLSSSARFRITSVASKLQPQPRTKVRVYGFTDDLASSFYGGALSPQRAVAVQRVLAWNCAAERSASRRADSASDIQWVPTPPRQPTNWRVEIAFSGVGDCPSSMKTGSPP